MKRWLCCLIRTRDIGTRESQDANAHQDVIAARVRITAATILLGMWLAGCAAPGQVGVKTPQSNLPNYPPAIEPAPEHQQAVSSAWQALAGEHQLPEGAQYDRDPILLTPRALPANLAGRIQLLHQSTPPTELELKEALRRFIEKHAVLLGVNPGDTAIGQPELSLVTLRAEGSMMRVVYQQRSFVYPLAEGWGELTLMLSKQGALLQWNSRLIPNVTLPARPTVEASTLPERFVNREFTYSNIAGQPMRYKIARVEEVFVKELVVYPRIANNRLTIHLAYPVVVGTGTTWTVHVDAMTGEELAVKANFVS